MLVGARSLGGCRTGNRGARSELRNDFRKRLRNGTGGVARAVKYAGKVLCRRLAVVMACIARCTRTLADDEREVRRRGVLAENDAAEEGVQNDRIGRADRGEGTEFCSLAEKRHCSPG